MTTGINIRPASGWANFEHARELSRQIWDGLSEVDGRWHYMNPTSGLSIWEATDDGSNIIMCYQGEDLQELLVTPGLAYDYLLPLV